LEEQRTDEVASERGEKRFLKYTFFRVVREWRFQSPEQKAKMKDEFLSVLDEHARRVGLQFFSLVGLRGDTDFMVLADSGDLEEFQRMVSELTATSLGRFLEVPYSYLAMTRRSHYLGSHRHAGQEGMARSAHTQSRYLFVYPFVKKREWYRLPFAERQRIMADHFRIGHKYPKIKINTGALALPGKPQARRSGGDGSERARSIEIPLRLPVREEEGVVPPALRRKAKNHGRPLQNRAQISEDQD